MSQLSDHEIWRSCFNVYPFSFTIRNRHKRHCFSRLWSWFCLRDKIPCTSVINTCNRNFFWRFCYVFLDSIHDTNARNSSVRSQRFDHDLHTTNVLDDNRPSLLGTGPIFVLRRIHPLTWDDSSLWGKVCSRHDPVRVSSGSSSSVMKNCPFLNILRESSNGVDFGQFLLFRNVCDLLLQFTQQVSLYCGISLRNRVSNKKFCRYRHWFQLLFRGGFSYT